MYLLDENHRLDKSSPNVLKLLFKAIGISCNPKEWRLFMASSSGSFKAMLLWEQVPDSPSFKGSFYALERRLQKCQNVTGCFE